MRTYDPDHIGYCINNLVLGLAYRMNRADGYFDRLDAALSIGDRLEEQSATVLRLERNAHTLRVIADSLDERRDALTDRAPRLRLVAAE